MPYTIRKVRGKPCFKLHNKKSKRVFSKCSTKENVIKQLRLLRAIEYDKNFVPRGGRTMKKQRTMTKRCKLTTHRCSATNKCYKKSSFIRKTPIKRCPRGTRKCRDNRCHKKV